MREMERSLREVPGTSDGQRPYQLGAGGDSQGSPMYTTIGNYTNEGGGHRTMKLGATAAAAGGEGSKPQRNSNGNPVFNANAPGASTKERRGSKAELLDTTEYMVSDYGGRIGEVDLEASVGSSGGNPRKSPRGGDRDGVEISANRAKLEKARSEREKAERDLLSMFNEVETGMTTEPKKYSYFAGSQAQVAAEVSKDLVGEGGNVSGGGGKKKAKKSLRRRSTQRGITEGRDERSN